MTIDFPVWACMLCVRGRKDSFTETTVAEEVYCSAHGRRTHRTGSDGQKRQGGGLQDQAREYSPRRRCEWARVAGPTDCRGVFLPSGHGRKRAAAAGVGGFDGRGGAQEAGPAVAFTETRRPRRSKADR